MAHTSGFSVMADLDELVETDHFVDSYKRAVYQRAPPRFSYRPLEPTKFGSSYSYGLAIYPTTSDNGSVYSGNGAQTADYEIWRRWEDCLYLQDILEVEYAKLVKGETSIRTRAIAALARPSQSSSGDRPLDPYLGSPIDARHATDVHVYLPRLGKKGTLFRPSAATIAQRGAEFHALVSALLGDGLPPVLRELRAQRVVHDFFGYWRRDYDLAQKTGMVPIVAVEPLPSLPVEIRKPARLRDPVVVSSVPSAHEVPSLSSGDSSDASSSGGGGSLSTPVSDNWRTAFAHVTLPPANIQSRLGVPAHVPSGEAHRVRKLNEEAGLSVRVDAAPDSVPPPVDRHTTPTRPRAQTAPSLSPHPTLISDAGVASSAASRVPTSAALSTWSPLRPRGRSVAEPSPSSTVNDTLPDGFVLQPVPAPGKSGKILVYSAAESAAALPAPRRSPLPEPPGSAGLPVPPPSVRWRTERGAMIESAPPSSMRATSSKKTDSVGTFGGSDGRSESSLAYLRRDGDVRATLSPGSSSVSAAAMERVGSGGTFGGSRSSQGSSSAKGTAPVLARPRDLPVPRPAAEPSWRESATTALSGSDPDSSASIVDMAFGTLGRASVAPPPRVMWLRPQSAVSTSAPALAPMVSPPVAVGPAFGTSRTPSPATTSVTVAASVSPAPSASASRAPPPPSLVLAPGAETPRKSPLPIPPAQLEAYLDLDVSHRWWRTSTATQMPPTPEPATATSASFSVGPATASTSTASFSLPAIEVDAPDAAPTAAIPPPLASPAPRALPHPPVMLSELRTASGSSGALTAADDATTVVGSVADVSDASSESAPAPAPRPSSLTAYAYVRERMRGNDPRLITTWAAFIPVGPDVEEEEEAAQETADLCGSRGSTPVRGNPYDPYQDEVVSAMSSSGY